MEDDDYWEHQRPSLRKTVCAWAILAALALIFAAAELVWPSQPAPLNVVSADTGARVRSAFDREERDDIEPVQDTDETVPDPRQIALER